MLVGTHDTRTDRNWRTRGRCRYAPDLFFEAENRNDADDAKKVCRSCPVLPECETWVADARPEFGVVAGMTPGERVARFGKPVAAYHQPVDEKKPKVALGKFCKLCGQQYTPAKMRQRYCRNCGLHHPDCRVRAFYGEVPR